MEYLNISQAAGRIGKSEHTIRRYAREGKLTKYRHGDNTLRFDKSEVDALKVKLNTIVKAG